MSSPPPNPSPSRWKMLPSRRGWWLVAAAFALGLTLFLLIWMSQRNDDGFFRAAPSTNSGSGQAFEPLPTPDAAGGETGNAPAGAGTAPLPDAPGTSAAAVPPTATPPLQREPAAPPRSQGPQSGSSAAVAVVHPAPRYPISALRNGEAGTVLLQVEVDAQGNPAQVDVVQSSRSRELDREARRTVQRWQFRPATRNGQAVASKVLVPVDFKADR